MDHQSNPNGYYRAPAIHGDRIVFVSEDDLWTVPAGGGIARRLTSGLGAAASPALSLDGRFLAFSGREEGPSEVYVMPADGGQPQRLTFLGANCNVVGWNPQGQIIFSSANEQPFGSLHRLYAIAPDASSSTEPRLLATGPAIFVSFSPAGGMVIARPAVEAAFWKRYRGGTAGDLWIDPQGNMDFRRLIKLDGNPSRPLWIGPRIFFICDHEGVGNVYSCALDGRDLIRHTHHDQFYVRGIATDGRRIIYHSGGDIYLFDPATRQSSPVSIDYRSPRTQRSRKFIDAARYLESFAVHGEGASLALTVRGHVATMDNFEGPVARHGEGFSGRYRLATWLSDVPVPASDAKTAEKNRRLLVVNDAEGRETLEIHYPGQLKNPRRLATLDIGHVVELTAAPSSSLVALANHRSQLMVIDVDAEAPVVRVIDRSDFNPVSGFAFSPDGRYLAYSVWPTLHTSVIRICRLEDSHIFPVTRPVLRDLAPAFDPEGQYLYFLSCREFDPVYDRLHFDLGFPRGMRPYLVTLRKDLPSPFAQPCKHADDADKKNGDDSKKDDLAKPATGANLIIDFDGIEDRILSFPVPEGIYTQIDGIKGKALFCSIPVEGSLRNSWYPTEPVAKAILEAFDFETGRAETLAKGISSFTISADHKALVYRAGRNLRVLKAGDKADDSQNPDATGRKSGWVDLSRLRLDVEPSAEWQQMYGEAWCLQQEQFWTEDMAHVDWKLIYDRYQPLLQRVSCRGEFTDLLAEMQGELGSSHAYVIGGDYRQEPRYDIGFLAADLAFDPSVVGGAWRIGRVICGDAWDETATSPLARPGVNVAPGDCLLAINGRRVDAAVSPRQLLVHQAGVEVELVVADAAGEHPRTVRIKTLKNEQPARYRQWVETNRDFVHDQSQGRCGYVHIPDMGPRGYAEFHRYYLAEVDRDGLLIDIRYNGGGHVSGLLLEKLARRRLAYIQTRWFGVQPHPDDSPAGPMVALTNQYAGSDGDIFSHNFKQLKLGPLLGKRTWGGVIGIWPRQTLSDGGISTQPEYSFWFQDAGWSVENYGVDPDIEVEYPPQAYIAGTDPQLQRSLDELLARLPKTASPQFGPHPDRSLPKLLGRHC